MESDQPPGPFPVTDLGRFGDPPVDVAPHDVFYDPDRRLWYCDIEIEAGASYWPFVRLALARYQPVSVGGAHLSEVVLADFMPLVADRWLNVNRTRVDRRRAVTVFGFTYHGSSGHDEARRAPSMSLINPITGQVTELTPAQVSPTSVVEVWLERLNPALGEDFGWERVAEGTPTPPPKRSGSKSAAAKAKAAADTEADAGSSFVLAPELARAHHLYQERDFDRLVNERLVGAVFAYTALWDGTVTLPADPSGGTRYRLVIAEYEEYLVDDDRPYDRVPTAKGRRLVFVEHVELT